MRNFSIKKILCLVLVTLSLFLTYSFGGLAPQTVVGHINYYGNAPFEFPGFETVDGYLYTIEIDEKASFDIKDITSQQGYLLELTGEIDKSPKNAFNRLKDGVFIISEWKRL